MVPPPTPASAVVSSGTAPPPAAAAALVRRSVGVTWWRSVLEVLWLFALVPWLWCVVPWFVPLPGTVVSEVPFGSPTSVVVVVSLVAPTVGFLVGATPPTSWGFAHLFVVQLLVDGLFPCRGTF